MNLRDEFLYLTDLFAPTGPSIIAGFGFSTEQSTLLNMAPGAVYIIGIGASWVVANYTNRTIGGLCPLILSCVGVIMMFTVPAENYAARYGGYVLTLLCKSSQSGCLQQPTLTRIVPIAMLFVVTFMTAGVAGSTKKVAFGAAYQLGYTVGNLVGPQTYQPGDAPDYYVSLVHRPFLIWDGKRHTCKPD